MSIKGTGNGKLVGQIIWSGHITVPKPRFHSQLYGITGWAPEPTPFEEFEKWVEDERSKAGLDNTGDATVYSKK